MTDEPESENQPRGIRIISCLQCYYFHLLEQRSKYDVKGYCENPDCRKDIPKGVRKITINPNWEGTEDRIYPMINSTYIPRWCKLQRWKD